MTREHAKKIITHLRNGKSDLMLIDALDMAISALSADGESDNKGQWIKIENGYKCSECGHIMDKVLSVSGDLIYQYSNYCPECGKKMCLEEPTEEEIQAFWLEAINSRCM